MCAIVFRIAFAQDALRNRNLSINCSWNWKGSKSKMLRRQATKGRNVVDKYLKTDAKIRTCTGLLTKTFNNLVKYVTQKSKKVWFKKGYFNQGLQKLQGIAKKDRATEETIS